MVQKWKSKQKNSNNDNPNIMMKENITFHDTVEYNMAQAVSSLHNNYNNL